MTSHLRIRTVDCALLPCPHSTQKLTSFVLINFHVPSNVYLPFHRFLPFFRTFLIKLLSHCENAEWSWYQMVDDREASWSCPLRVTLPSLAWVSARNMSSKSWSASMGTSTPWLGLVSIPLRRLAQAGTHSPDSASLYCEDTPVSVRMSFEHRYSTRLLSSLGCAYLNLCFMIARGCLLAERHICTRIVQNSFAHPLEILSSKEFAISLRLASSDESVFTMQTG